MCFVVLLFVVVVLKFCFVLFFFGRFTFFLNFFIAITL